MNRKIVLSGAILVVLAIILGAFGAHSLKDLIIPEKLLSFETGVRYQMYQGLALLIIGLNEDKFANSLKVPYSLIISGVILFSGSIYFLSIEEVVQVKMKFFGPVTPLGGVLMIVGWLLIIIKLLPANGRQQ